MNPESAIDLSMKHPRTLTNPTGQGGEFDGGTMGEDAPILRPIPRPPWSIIWYQNLWPTAFRESTNSNTTSSSSSSSNNNNNYNRASNTPQNLSPGIPLNNGCHDNSHVFRRYTSSARSGGEVGLPTPLTLTPIPSFSETTTTLFLRAESGPPSMGFHPIPTHTTAGAPPPAAAAAAAALPLPWTKFQVHGGTSFKFIDPPASNQRQLQHHQELQRHEEENETDDRIQRSRAPKFRHQESISDSETLSCGEEGAGGTPEGAHNRSQSGMTVGSSLRVDGSGGGSGGVKIRTAPTSPSSSSTTNTATGASAIVDVACCDGPVRFERISNPNFALTVEHPNPPPPPPPPPALPSSPVTVVAKSHPDPRAHDGVTSYSCPTSTNTTISSTSSSHDTGTVSTLATGVTTSGSRLMMTEPSSRAAAAAAAPATKTYLCIYCNQSFKSLFCYQKHKKRHLNPVSVDITGINVNVPTNVYGPENHVRTKDLNVQFFPCKKCGCKFPSYYFVHKHKKTCHS